MNDYPIQPVSFTDVRLYDRFWSPRIETNRTVTIPFAFEQCQKNARMYNFQRAAARLRGEIVTDTKHSEFSFDDTDVYKIIEGAAYSMAVKADTDLDAYVDGLIEQIAAAQKPDGYLYSARTLAPEPPHSWAGTERWVKERDGSASTEERIMSPVPDMSRARFRRWTAFCAAGNSDGRRLARAERRPPASCRPAREPV